jgi:hypothetical protein
LVPRFLSCGCWLWRCMLTHVAACCLTLGEGERETEWFLEYLEVYLAVEGERCWYC